MDEHKSLVADYALCPVCRQPFRKLSPHRCQVARGMKLTMTREAEALLTSQQRRHTAPLRGRVRKRWNQLEEQQQQTLLSKDAKQKQAKNRKRRGRKNFTDPERLTIVEYAEIHGIDNAAVEHDLSVHTITEWSRWKRHKYFEIRNVVTLPVRESQKPKITRGEAPDMMRRLFEESDLSQADAEALRAGTARLTTCIHCQNESVYRDKNRDWRHLRTGKIECGPQWGTKSLSANTAMPKDERRTTVRGVRMITP